MPRYQFDKVARAALLDELIAAGFPATTPVEMDDARVWVTADEADYDRMAAVVAAHNAAAIDAVADAEKTQFQQDVANLKTYQGLASPTAAQTAAATKAQNRILRRVVSELRD